MTTIHIITDDTDLTRKTLRLMDLHGLDYTTQSVTDPGAKEALAATGLKHTPVIKATVRGQHLIWNGFRPDLIVRVLIRGRL